MKRVDFIVTRVDQMEDCQIIRGRRRPSISKDIETNDFDRDVIYERTL